MEVRVKLLWLICIILTTNCTCTTNAQKIETSLKEGGQFDIKINGMAWFEQNFTKGSQVFVTSDSQRIELNAEQEPEYFNGEDVLGSFSGHSLHWIPRDKGFQSLIRVYNKDPLVVFSQRFQVNRPSKKIRSTY